MNQVYEYVTQTAWAMHPGVYRSLVDVVTRHAAGTKLDREEVDAIVAAGRQGRDGRDTQDPREGVAVIPVRGVIARHANQVNGSSQPRGTSVHQMQKQLRAAVDDPAIRSIVLDIDSPGGSVHGVAELADEIRAARGTKPIVAHVDGMMASAAYWIGAQADQVIATPSSQAGSIGVYAQLVDDHRYYESAGVDVSIVKAGKHKGAGAPGQRVSEEDRAAVQQKIDDYYQLFVGAVAKGRGIDPEQALALADGDTHVAGRALDLGLIDAIGTFEDAIAVAGRASSRTSGLAARVIAARSEVGDEHDAASISGHEPQGTGMGKEGNPAIDSVAALEAEHSTLVATVRADAQSSAIKAERERCSKIIARATESQHALAAKLVAEGTDYPTALEALVDDPRREAHATKVERANASTPAVEPLTAATAHNADPISDPESAWLSNAELRRTFANSKSRFIAAMENADNIRIGGRTLTQIVRS